MFPTKSRAWGAGILQSASGVGFFAAILLNHLVGGNWRHAFICGAIPAFLALLVRTGLSEPEAWKRVHQEHERSGSLAELFGTPHLRRRVLAATGVALFGIAAYWSTNFLAPTALVQLINGDPVLKQKALDYKTLGLSVMTLGNIAGFLSYVPLAEGAGRKWAFAVFHLLSLISMPVAFLCSKDYTTWLVLFFIAGACTSGIYTGYTITFPELFPTRIRATGAGFCYNVSRVVAAPGPVILGALQGYLLSHYTLSAPQAIAIAGSLMAGLYLFAMAFIPALPETKNVNTE
jgi:MFS family permease